MINAIRLEKENTLLTISQGELHTEINLFVASVGSNHKALRCLVRVLADGTVKVYKQPEVIVEAID